MSGLDRTIREFCSYCAYPDKVKNLKGIITYLCDIIDYKEAMDTNDEWEIGNECVSVKTMVTRARAAIE